GIGKRLTGNHVGFVFVGQTKLLQAFVHFVHLGVRASQVVVEQRILRVLPDAVLKRLFCLGEITRQPVGHAQVVHQYTKNGRVQHALLFFQIEGLLVVFSGGRVVTLLIETGRLEKVLGGPAGPDLVLRAGIVEAHARRGQHFLKQSLVFG